MTIYNDNGTIVVTGSDDIGSVMLLTLRSRLRLEGKGLKCKGPSTLSIVKKQFGLKGNLKTVLPVFEELVKQRTGV